MTQITNLLASLNKPSPPSIHVSCEVLTYSENDTASFEKGLDGINPSILILDVVVKKGGGPMKGTYKKVKPEDFPDDDSRYKQVTVRYEGEEQTVDIH